MKKKSIVTIAIILLTIVVVSGCIDPLQPGDGNTNELEITQQQIQDQELLQKATAENNLAYCENVKTAVLKAFCLKTIITAETPATDCAQFSDQETRDKCYNNLVNLTKDTSLCENIVLETRKTRCLKKG